MFILDRSPVFAMLFSKPLASLIALALGAESFSVPPRRASPFLATGPLRMSEPKDGTKLVTKSNKEIGYDSSSGRFYETGEESECVPDDEYCVVDKTTGKLIRLTLEEKERIFVDSLQSYYMDGRQLLNDAEFDLLKEDLQWNGSPTVTFNRDEARYLAAVQAFMKGQPIIEDDEFDSLKARLKADGSKFAVSTQPKCYIDTGICTVTFKDDKFRNNLLYLPAGFVLFLAWLGIGYETLGLLIKINPVILILLGSPLIYNGAKTITDDFIFKNKKIVYGPCPSCEAENRIFFGDILGVEGFDQVADAKCSNCKAQFKVQRGSLRASTLPK